MPLQTSCPYVFEDPYRPAHVLRKAYAQQMRERERSEQPAELQLLRKILEE